MFMQETNDRLLDELLDSQEGYPDEVLQSEWNPLVAQIQLIKSRQKKVDRQATPLWLTLPELELEVED